MLNNAIVFRWLYGVLQYKKALVNKIKIFLACEKYKLNSLVIKNP